MSRRIACLLAVTALVVTAVFTNPSAAQEPDSTPPPSPAEQSEAPPVDYRPLVLSAVDGVENLTRASVGVGPRTGARQQDSSPSLMSVEAALLAVVDELSVEVAAATAAVAEARANLVPESERAAAAARIVAAEDKAEAAKRMSADMSSHRQSLALSAYMGVQSEGLTVVGDINEVPSVAVLASVADQWLTDQQAAFNRDADRYTELAESRRSELIALEQRATQARDDLDGAEEALATAEAELAEAQQWLELLGGAAAERAEQNRSAYDLAQDRYQWAMTLAGLSAPRVANPGLTIVGQSRLDASELMAWVRVRNGGFVRPEVSELIDLYLEEGALAGVRGDVAFMQAALETGYFRFTGSHNYAGIGHCDSCPKGYDYTDARQGVRAQVQLLRFYADATVRTADLGAPPAISWLDDAYAQGCCVTWFGLTGVWASALHYGPSILAMYEQALAAAGKDPAAAG